MSLFGCLPAADRLPSVWFVTLHPCSHAPPLPWAQAPDHLTPRLLGTGVRSLRCPVCGRIYAFLRPLPESLKKRVKKRTKLRSKSSRHLWKKVRHTSLTLISFPSWILKPWPDWSCCLRFIRVLNNFLYPSEHLFPWLQVEEVRTNNQISADYRHVHTHGTQQWLRQGPGWENVANENIKKKIQPERTGLALISGFLLNPDARFGKEKQKDRTLVSNPAGAASI